VLEHVGKARFATWIVHRSHIGQGIKGDHRRIMALHDNEMQAIRQGELRHLLLKIG
jgi:hypothetical protein